MKGWECASVRETACANTYRWERSWFVCGVLSNSEHLEFKKEIIRARKRAQWLKEEIAQESLCGLESKV